MIHFPPSPQKMLVNQLTVPCNRSCSAFKVQIKANDEIGLKQFYQQLKWNDF